VTVRAELLDKEYKPINDAEVVATIEDPLGKKKPLKLEWILSEEGVYQSQFEPVDAGEYKITVDATLKDKTNFFSHLQSSLSDPKMIQLCAWEYDGINTGLLICVVPHDSPP